MPDILPKSLKVPTVPSPKAATWADAPVAARTLHRLLDRLTHGRLDVQWPDGLSTRHGHDAQPRASLAIHDWSVCATVLRSGDIGFAEAYIDGRWTTHDLTGLMTVLLVNRDALESAIYGRWWGALFYRLKHVLHRNSRTGSRRNIHAHYDLGNAFYERWLDASMNYSSAWFDGDRARPLVDAQQAKMRRALCMAGLHTPGQRVLEIGCGWGAVAEMATRDFGARLTGVTLSTEQLTWGQARLARQDLGGQAELRLQDYRDLRDEPFDAIVSIEMFEAVGREYWDGYFQTVQRLLKPGARACIQSITIRDDLFERYSRSTDFIQQYIFPGGMLPSPSQFRAAAERAGLVVEDQFAFGPTMPRRCGAGGPISNAICLALPSSVSTSAPSASGPSTCATAKRRSTAATPTSCSSP